MMMHLKFLLYVEICADEKTVVQWKENIKTEKYVSMCKTHYSCTPELYSSTVHAQVVHLHGRVLSSRGRASDHKYKS